MAIVLLLPEKCDCLKLWFGKPVCCKINAFLLLLLHQVIILSFFQAYILYISVIQDVMVLNMYHVLQRATWAIIGLLLWLEVDFHYFLQQGVKTCLLF